MHSIFLPVYSYVLKISLLKCTLLMNFKLINRRSHVIYCNTVRYLLWCLYRVYCINITTDRSQVGDMMIFMGIIFYFVLV